MEDPKKNLKKVLKKEIAKSDPVGAIHNEILDHTDQLESVQEKLDEIKSGNEEVAPVNQKLAEFIQNVKGEKGDKGDQGEPGETITGPQGEQGVPGPKGEIGITGPKFFIIVS